MAQKKITDLTLRSNFDGTVNLPGDDTAQTWRVTGAQMLAYIRAAIDPDVALGDRKYRPVVQKFLASGTYNQSYWFDITAGNATIAATYTNNGITYTVVETVAAGTRVLLRGNGLPIASGTLTKSAGTGDTTLTFSAYRKPLYIDSWVVGGGGSAGGTAATSGSQKSQSSGGGGGGSSFRKIMSSSLGLSEVVTVGTGGAAATAGGAGVAGGNSSLGALHAANGGAGGIAGAATSTAGGNNTNVGGAGGTSSGGDINVTGGCGGTSGTFNGENLFTGYGGASHFAGSVPMVNVQNSSGTLGAAPGGGSSPASSTLSQSARVSTAGADGMVFITEHYQ